MKIYQPLKTLIKNTYSSFLGEDVMEEGEIVLSDNEILLDMIVSDCLINKTSASTIAEVIDDLIEEEITDEDFKQFKDSLNTMLRTLMIETADVFESKEVKTYLYEPLSSALRQYLR